VSSVLAKAVAWEVAMLSTKTDQIVVLTRALLVIVRDPKIREWLKHNDPKALAQATKALEEAGYDPAYREV
jgi:hypothetical protein